jgi:hypothetical protein
VFPGPFPTEALEGRFISSGGMRLLTFSPQLNVVVPIDPDYSLVQRLADLCNIATYLKELSSGQELGEIFPEPRSKKHFHSIVVQYPAPSSPSGE